MDILWLLHFFVYSFVLVEGYICYEQDRWGKGVREPIRNGRFNLRSGLHLLKKTWDLSKMSWVLIDTFFSFYK